MFADLHCHYPMHLLPGDKHPQGHGGSLLERLRAVVDAQAVALAADLFNDPDWGSGWRVDLDGLVQGEVRIACSVLYWPADEFRLCHTPAPGSFHDLQHLLSLVEADLAGLDPAGQHHVVVKTAADLPDDGRVGFVHAVEGGLLLGPDESKIDANVRWLAEHGVLYITLAHLFFFGVATNAPAFPMLTDSVYADLFPQPAGAGLTDLGKAAVRSMYRHKVLVDISHMSEAAIDDTFALIEQLDDETHTDPRAFPVLATHVGMRSANSDPQSYNLTVRTAERIQRRGGLIGLILAQHQLGYTRRDTHSQKILRRHIEAIERLGNGLDCCAFGTDLDGFIRPTLTGIERARDLATPLADWIQADFPNDADGILHGNARRLVERVLAARTPPPAPPP